MSSINYNNLSEVLIKQLPQLRDKYEEYLLVWRGKVPGPHNVFAEILNPHIDSLLNSEGNEIELAAIFDFLEYLLHCGDEPVQEVVVVTVLEHLDSPQSLLERARKYMGEQTLYNSIEVEKASWDDPSGGK